MLKTERKVYSGQIALTRAEIFEREAAFFDGYQLHHPISPYPPSENQELSGHSGIQT
jgi:hypothetical protein